ncbi:MAG: sulfotransferase domain-containing protein [Acidimicrobiales bacterium]
MSDPEVLTPRGGKRYAALYAHGPPAQRIGDASTSYSKLPDITGVPRRARQVLGPDIRIIYSVRNPIERARSHHHHLLIRNKVPPDFEGAVAVTPGIRDFGLYAMQLEAWAAEFPMSQIQVIRFEDYAENPTAVLDEVLAFLELPAGSAIPGLPIHVTTKVRPLTDRQASLRRRFLYRRIVRPMVPQSVRNRATVARHTEAARQPLPPLPATREALNELYADDGRRLATMLQVEQPFWPLTP